MRQTSKSTTWNHKRRTHRRGSLYVAVMGVTMIVAMMALTAMHVVRLNLNSAIGRHDRYEAALLGSSAVEIALIALANDPDWRTNLLSGVEYPATPVTLGGGTFTFKLVDEDGNLADDLSDSVMLQGIGRVGGVTHVEQVRLQPTGSGLTCLEASLHCHGDISTGSDTDLTTNQIVSSNGSIDTAGWNSSITGDTEAVGSINGNISGNKTSGITPRQMPGSSVFDYYVNMGTMIDINQLAAGTVYELTNVLLSPQSNPYGSPNPEGIYVIDCQGGNLWIQNVRVFGTLVLLNPAATSSIRRRVHFEPAVVNFPSLLVSGGIQFKYDSSVQLSESALGVNFNPVGSPYQGNEDADMSDTYPCVIKGLVYVSGELDLRWLWNGHHSAVDGVVVCGSIAANSDFLLTYRSTFLDYPPPGFAAGNEMEISPGSWVRATSP